MTCINPLAMVGHAAVIVFMVGVLCWMFGIPSDSGFGERLIVGGVMWTVGWLDRSWGTAE